MIEIAGRKIGPDYPPFFVADLGSNHDGSLPRYCTLIDIAADAGADAVKGQIFSAPKLVSRHGFAELGQIGHQEAWEKDVYSTYEDAAIPLEWILVLAQRCKVNGIAFLCTAYDLQAVDAIDPYVEAHKLGSGDVTYHELIRHIALKNKPVLLATGASTQYEVRRALEMLDDEPGSGKLRVPVALLQCNSDYTGGDLRYTNLRTLLPWQERGLAHVVGLSDHTAGHTAVCTAVALGASLVEKHFTDDKGRPGPDHAFAMEPEEWRDMVTAARQTWEALGDGVKRVEENEREARIVQRRALRWVYDLSPEDCIPSGLARENFIATRPCPEGALEPCHLDDLVGRFLKRDVEADTLVRLEDLE